MFKWVFFFHTVDKQHIFWFCNGDTEQIARDQFALAYQKMGYIMDTQGYWIARVP